MRERIGNRGRELENCIWVLRFPNHNYKTANRNLQHLTTSATRLVHKLTARSKECRMMNKECRKFEDRRELAVAVFINQDIEIANGWVRDVTGIGEIGWGQVSLTDGSNKTASGRVNLACGGGKVVCGRGNIACGTRQMRLSAVECNALCRHPELVSGSPANNMRFRFESGMTAMNKECRTKEEGRELVVSRLAQKLEAHSPAFSSYTSFVTSSTLDKRLAVGSCSLVSRFPNRDYKTANRNSQHPKVAAAYSPKTEGRRQKLKDKSKNLEAHGSMPKAKKIFKTIHLN